jgi:hypothetical protein
MIEMKRLALLLLVLLVACGPTPTVTSTVPAALNNMESTPVPKNVDQTPVVSPTTMIQESELWLQITSPLDEAVVTLPQVEVTGSAPAGSVISVNEDILIVGADGQFKTTIALEEGPNLIEIIASDENGNETSALLTVTYEP